MTAPFRAPKGDMFVIDGQYHELDRRSDDGYVLRPAGTNGGRNWTGEELLSLYFAKRLRIERPARDLPADLRKLLAHPFDCFPESERKVACFWLHYMTACDEYFRENPKTKRPELGYTEVSRQVTEKLRELYAEGGEHFPDLLPKAVRFHGKNPGGSTVRRHYLRWLQAGRMPHALIPLHAEKGSREAKIDPEVEQIALGLIREHFLVREQPPLKETHELVEAEIARKNAARVEPLPGLSYEGLRRILNRELDPFEICYIREGKEKAEQKYGVGIANQYAAEYMERVEIDHSPLDLIALLQDGSVAKTSRKLRKALLSEAKVKSRKAVGRPWLSVAIDVATRCIVAFHISMDPPSRETIMRLLRMMVSPEAELGENTRCPRHGLPKVIVLDNETAHHSNAIVAACACLNIRVEYAPRNRPKAKAIVERTIGTIQRGFLSTLPGKTFSSPQKRGDYDSVARAGVRLSELTPLFEDWMLRIYHQRSHRGLLGFTPQQRLEALRHVGILLPPDPDQLDALLAETVERTIQGDGITFCGLRYADPAGDLARLRKSYHLGREWMVKIDPADISRVAVLDDTDEIPRWIWIPCQTPHLVEGLDLADWRTICEIARSQQREGQRVGRDALLAARERFFALARERGVTPGRLPRPKVYAEIIDNEAFFDGIETIDEADGKAVDTGGADELSRRMRGRTPVAASGADVAAPVSKSRGVELPDYEMPGRDDRASGPLARDMVESARRAADGFDDERWANAERWAEDDEAANDDPGAEPTEKPVETDPSRDPEISATPLPDPEPQTPGDAHTGADPPKPYDLADPTTWI